MTSQVKVFRSTDPGAPVLTGTSGSMIALLDACLVNGYGLITVDGMTSAAGVATATRSAGHSYSPGDVILVSGADQSAYLGEKVITATTSTTFQFSVEGSPVSPATGTITTKRAPIGCTKLYTGTNKAVYRRDDVTASASLMRVDDSNALYARIRSYESMTDVDTGSGPSPTVAQMANGVTWAKSSSSDSTARPWTAVGDGLCFYLFAEPFANYTSIAATYGFGDMVSWKMGDVYPTMLIGHGMDSPSNPTHTCDFCVVNAAASSGKYLQRSFTQIGNAIQFASVSSVLTPSYTGVGNFAYPSAVDGGLMVSPIYVYETAAVRGVIPGVYAPCQNLPLAHGNIAGPVAGLAARSLLMLATMAVSSNARIAVDITGPWR